jgi:hypothetical protein
MTEADARHCERVAVIGDNADWWQLMLHEDERRKRLVERRVVSELYRLLRPGNR